MINQWQILMGVYLSRFRRMMYGADGRSSTAAPSYVKRVITSICVNRWAASVTWIQQAIMLIQTPPYQLPVVDPTPMMRERKQVKENVIKERKECNVENYLCQIC